MSTKKRSPPPWPKEAATGMKVIMEDYLCAIDAANERVSRCEVAMADLLVSWQLRPAVEALMGFKGFQIGQKMGSVKDI